MSCVDRRHSGLVMRHTVQMDPEYRLSRIRHDGGRLIDLAAADPVAKVPACPGWSAARLLSHSGRVWNSVALHVERLTPEPISGSEVPRADEGLEVEYARTAHAKVVAALDSADPAESVWTWAGDGTVGFYLRRMHQETLIHRIDAEQAAGEPSEVAAVDAADGVDELMCLLLPASVSNAPAGSLHLHQTDGPGEWMMNGVDGNVVASIGHEKGDAAIRATAADLLLAGWQRRSLEGLEIFGDRAIAEEWMTLSA